MKKTNVFLLTVIAAIIISSAFSGCQKREPEPEQTSSTPQSSSKAEPVKPGTAEAARNNLSIKADTLTLVQFEEPAQGDKVAVIETSEGDVKVRLFSSQAPKTVEEFIRLVEAGHYNGQIFGTVVPGYKAELTGPAGDAKYPADGEFSLDLWNFSGAVVLANNGSDFMIVDAKTCLNPRTELEQLNFPKDVVDKYFETGGAPHQDWKNTVFGHVIDGMDVINAITNAKVDDSGKPLDPTVIGEIIIEEYTAEQDEKSE